MTPNSPSNASKIQREGGRSNTTSSNSPRYDRINNIGGSGTTKRKRIRARTNGVQLINTLNRQVSVAREPANPSPKSSKSSSESSKPKDEKPHSTKNRTLPSSSPSNPMKRKYSSESDSDMELNLINVSNYSSSPVKSKNLDRIDVQRMDNLLGNQEECTIDIIQEPESGRSNHKSEKHSESQSVSSLALGNFLETIQDRKASARAHMEKKHKHKYPEPIRSKRVLCNRANKHLHHILSILEGRSKGVSMVHNIARKRQRESHSETLSQKEYWQVDWQLFYAGYFGFQRQQYLASLINNKYSDELKKAAKNDPVVAYWTQDGYSTYILANDLAVRLVMEDFSCNFEKAEEILRTSSEYGVAVTDEIELEDDDYSKEEEFVKKREEEEKNDKSIKSSPINSKTNQIDTNNSLDILDQLVQSYSDSLDN